MNKQKIYPKKKRISKSEEKREKNLKKNELTSFIKYFV